MFQWDQFWLAVPGLVRIGPEIRCKEGVSSRSKQWQHEVGRIVEQVNAILRLWAYGRGCLHMHAYINTHKYKCTCIQLCIQAKAQCIWCEKNTPKGLRKAHSWKSIALPCLSSIFTLNHRLASKTATRLSQTTKVTSRHSWDGFVLSSVLWVNCLPSTPEQKQVQTSGAHQHFENKSLLLVPELLPPNSLR